MSLITEFDVSIESLSLSSIKGAEPLGSNKDVILHVEEVKSILGFLDLPREIRDYVYEIMFLREEPLYPSVDRAGVAAYSGLLRTNHQVYAEAVEILYGYNILQIRGVPAWKAPDLLNLIARQSRDELVRGFNSVCIARFHLKKLYIPSHGIGLDRLKHLISLLKYFPNLEYLRVVYLASFGVKDMEVINVCRLLKDRRPLLQNFVLCKRVSYKEAEDISWMVNEKPYRNWTPILQDPARKHVWRNQDGSLREALVVLAPQNIPE